MDSPNNESLQSAFVEVLSNYVSQKTKAFSYQSPIHLLFNSIEQKISRILNENLFSTLLTKSSCGIGNWSDVPWLGILDSRRTTSIQKGIYVVFLFKKDMSGFYLTLNQGIKELEGRYGWRKAKEILKRNTQDIQKLLSDLDKKELTRKGFNIDSDIFLSNKGTGTKYVPGTIVNKFYGKEEIINSESFQDDIKLLSNIYLSLPNDDESTSTFTETKSSWIFQANPNIYDLKNAITELSELTFSVSRYKEEMHIGDSVFFWLAGNNAGVVGLGQIVTEPDVIDTSLADKKFFVDTNHFVEDKTRVKIKVIKPLTETITKDELRKYQELQNLSILKSPQGTNFRVSKSEGEKLMELISAQTTTPIIKEGITKIKQIPFSIDNFLSDLFSINLRFASDFIARFVAALLTKPFVILTGLSGSGKTQLAIAFSNWISESDEQVCIVPVGADWTNREPLLGYVNALEPGKYVKPDTGVIDLIIRAINNTIKPYFLLLDEMNLSHVERYFADFLSVMESDKSIYMRPSGSSWLDTEIPSTIRIPSNLFIIGTVNIDETTYMFSPKVLDRAGVLEFRVTSGDMQSFLDNPIKEDTSKISGLGAPMAEDFVRLSKLKVEEYDQSEELTKTILLFFDELKMLGAEFGYRTASEIFRYGGILNEISKKDQKVTPEQVIDAAIMLKLLPKIHGSRRKLEPVLKSLMSLCLKDSSEELLEKIINTENSDLLTEDNVRFPITLEKLLRMYKHVIHDGFTSFAEA